MTAGDDRSLRRHLLGFGIFLVTMICGYMASSANGVGDISRVTEAPAPTGLAQAPGPDSPAIEIDSHIEDVAARYGVSKDLIAAIIEAESRYNPRAISPRGAQGLMQLMPETAAILGVGNPFDPRQNIEGGVRHLRSLMDRFGNNLPLALAAYNAGERAVVSHGGIPPYPETRQYVRRILRQLARGPAPLT